MSRVFIIQNIEKRNRSTGRFEPMYDFTDAASFGEPCYLLDPDRNASRTAGVVADLMEGLQDINEEDYLVLVGNPALIGMATAIAAAYTEGKLKLLQWDKKFKKYMPIPVDLPVYR